MKNVARYEKLMNESRERSRFLQLLNLYQQKSRFVKILDEMITLAEHKRNVIVLDRKMFNKIERLSK